MIYFDTELIVRAVNDAFLADDRVAREDIVGRHVSDLLGPSVFETRLGQIKAALNGEETCIVDWGQRGASRGRLLRIHHIPVRGEGGDVVGVLVRLEDATRLHDLERRVSMLGEVFNQTADGLAVIGTDYRYVWANHSYTRRWNLMPDQVVGRAVAEIVGTRSYMETVLIPLSRCFCGENVAFEDVTSTFDGTPARFAIRLEPFRDENGTIIGAVVNRRDVSDVAAMIERIERHETEDALTGLPNRSAFEENLSRQLGAVATCACDTQECLSAVMVLNLDDFRTINDMAGYAAGDVLLRQVARHLAALVPDAYLARLGGDDYAMLLCGVDQRSAVALGEKIVAAIGNAGFEMGTARYSVGASIGIVPIDQDAYEGAASSVSDVMKRADRACRVARDAGGARVSVYHPEDSDILARNEEVMNVRVIQEALRQDRFELHVMPIAPIGNGSGDYDEILLRVLDEAGTPMPPGNFIAAAERHGLMSRVDRWVVEAVLARLPGVAADARLSVNLSGQSVGDARFRDFLIEALDAAAPRKGQISFEITETSAIRSMETARDLIAALRARGCGIILDDFGSGLSSFGYLRRFDIDMLKIDGSIIGGLRDDTVQQTIVAGIVAVAEAMSIRVVAEYVEDLETMALLGRLGVSFAQGYAIGRPARWTVEAPGPAS
ncbi:EAL domain-containing protein [Stappia sp. ICDLI1TA098]